MREAPLNRCADAMADDLGIRLRTLRGAAQEMRDLQRVLEGAPAYAELVTGVPPGPADAQSLYSVLPEGKSYDDKFVLGIEFRHAMIGCVDLIRAYPDPASAHLGLLLVAEPYQGRGLGSKAAACVEAFAASWPGCTRIRLGVLRANPRAMRFWTKEGYAPTGEVKPYAYGAVRSEVVLFAKAL